MQRFGSALVIGIQHSLLEAVFRFAHHHWVEFLFDMDVIIVRALVLDAVELYLYSVFSSGKHPKESCSVLVVLYELSNGGVLGHRFILLESFQRSQYPIL